jgi:hypothetical protein
VVLLLPEPFGAHGFAATLIHVLSNMAAFRRRIWHEVPSWDSAKSSASCSTCETWKWPTLNVRYCNTEKALTSARGALELLSVAARLNPVCKRQNRQIFLSLHPLSFSYLLGILCGHLKGFMQARPFQLVQSRCRALGNKSMIVSLAGPPELI